MAILKVAMFKRSNLESMDVDIHHKTVMDSVAEYVGFSDEDNTELVLFYEVENWDSMRTSASLGFINKERLKSLALRNGQFDVKFKMYER